MLAGISIVLFEDWRWTAVLAAWIFLLSVRWSVVYSAVYNCLSAVFNFGVECFDAQIAVTGIVAETAVWFSTKVDMVWAWGIKNNLNLVSPTVVAISLKGIAILLVGVFAYVIRGKTIKSYYWTKNVIINQWNKGVLYENVTTRSNRSRK